ncbi:hypothetical protein TURU_018366 [Turdus rufiventris]|nr:hypothetical protein TURU_018366 [Turdus rufiventris]
MADTPFLQRNLMEFKKESVKSCTWGGPTPCTSIYGGIHSAGVYTLLEGNLSEKTLYFHTMYLGIRSRQSGENDRWRFYWKMVYEYADESVSPAFALSTAKLPGTGGITMGNASTGEVKEDKAAG